MGAWRLLSALASAALAWTPGLGDPSATYVGAILAPRIAATMSSFLDG